MPRPHRQILPFRIPFFRIFYSTTYTVIFIILLFFLAITPASLLWEAIENQAVQYIIIIGGTYVLTGIIAIFIYSSRLYTNRSVLAGVGKAYIPIEDDEVGRTVRRMIAKQLKRSAIISWEARPRDLGGEVIYAEKTGIIRPEDRDVMGKVDTIGTIIPVDTQQPPWGNVQHRGWTAPSDAVGELQSNLQFDAVIAELSNLLEAKAVALAPADSSGLKTADGQPAPDLVLVEALCRQEKMGMREYLLQLSYLQLVDLDTSGGELLSRYEAARFSGRPPSIEEFQSLMTVFGIVLDDMHELNPAIAREIKLQSASLGVEEVNNIPQIALNVDNSSSKDSVNSSVAISPVTANTRMETPYLEPISPDGDSLNSVLWSGHNNGTSRTADASTTHTNHDNMYSSPDSDAGSVVHHAR